MISIGVELVDVLGRTVSPAHCFLAFLIDEINEPSVKININLIEVVIE